VPSSLDAQLRLWIYRHFVEVCRAPSVIEIASRFGITSKEVEEVLGRLEKEADALVLIPGTRNIWMAEPFSAVPTAFVVRSGNRQWWGNCIWDGLAILALLGLDGTVSTACPQSAMPLAVTVADRTLKDVQGVVHIAVPAADWWCDIGFT
jgi:hypothetical protein